MLIAIETLAVPPQFYHTGIEIGMERLLEVHLLERKMTMPF
ncbi:MAG: hypothetical protein PVS3B1_30040 [Ktedonobacteraceae bacterium]